MSPALHPPERPSHTHTPNQVLKGEGATSTRSRGGRLSFAHFFSTSCSTSEVLRTYTTNTWCINYMYTSYSSIKKEMKREENKRKVENETNFGFVLLSVIHSIFHRFSEGTVSAFHTALSPPIFAPTVVCIARANWINSGCGRREAYKIWSMGFPE